ncbi:NlpC/P60 family protein, partial [Weissella viridescens]|uniref:NlpC/P60 family protein n=1 Tax=Weissella viridescens TaxID=1629 RepID=UPI000A9F1657
SNDVKKQLASVQHLPLNEAMPGDLLFWGTPDLISNAGVYLGGERYLTVDLMGGIVMIQTVSKTWEPDFVGSLR